MQVYVQGVSTRRVDDLVIAMGGTGISRSEVCRICAQLDADVAIRRTRRLEHIALPCVPRRYLLQGPDQPAGRVPGRRHRDRRQCRRQTGDGRREVHACATGDSETQEFWTDSLRDLRERGLDGVQLVISDAPSGLVKAVGTVLQGVSWQRFRVHFMRNVLAKVGKGHDEMVAATIRTIFAQPGQGEVRAQVDLIASMLAGQFPAVAQILPEAKTDLTASSDFPHPNPHWHWHWHKIWRTNPLTTQPHVKRRTDVVGIFPNPAALLRLSSYVLIEAHGEYRATGQGFVSLSTVGGRRA